MPYSENLHKCIGVFSSDQKLTKTLTNYLKDIDDVSFSIQFCDNTEKAIEFLHYELPDIVIIDLDSQIPNLDKVQKLIKEDPWLTGMSIIALYDAKAIDYLNEMTRFSLIALIEKTDIEPVKKVLQSVMRTRAMLVDSSYLYTFRSKPHGEIILANDIVKAEKLANQISSYLLEANHIDKNKYYSINMGLSELLINAIEHGNCEISFSEKTKLLENGTNMIEYIQNLSQKSPFKDRVVKLRYEINEDRSTWEITDEGSGFDVQKYLTFDPERLLLAHGRGIMMAKNSSDELLYNQKGNQVILVCKHSNKLDFKIPIGFLGQEQVTFEPGDYVFHEGEESTNIYYILTGDFKVMLNNNCVGSLGVSDMFMGEMSFLLNNRRSASVIASSKARLLKISKKSFIGIIKKYPNYMILLSRLLAMRLSRANTGDLASAT